MIIIKKKIIINKISLQSASDLVFQNYYVVSGEVKDISFGLNLLDFQLQGLNPWNITHDWTF